MKIKITDIQPHSINDQIYSTTDLTDLIKSINNNGQLEPIVINKNNTILSGHRRYFSMIQLGFTECEVRIVDHENEVISLINYNQQRKKTATDLTNEIKILESEYKGKGLGQGQRNDMKGFSSQKVYIDMSKRLGIGLSKMKQLKSINHYEPQLLKQVDRGELSVSKAYSVIRSKYMKPKVITDDQQMESKIHSFLDREKPNTEVMLKSLQNHYPYSLMNFSMNQYEELNNKRTELIDHMEYLKRLDNREIVIYKKLKEIQKNKFDDKTLDRIHNKIYQFSNLNDLDLTLKEIDQLDPILVSVEDLNEFKILRILIHSFEWVPSPGRNLKYFIIDRTSKKYLGIITLGSDVISLPPRDQYIGWSRENKFDHKKLNSVSIAQTIVGVQPFGYNMLGGKLIASLCSDPMIQKDWKKKYKDTLTGITTTSLFGSYSMYNRIPYWKKLGKTKGSITIKPDDDIFFYWNEWIKENHKKEFEHAINQSSPKQNIIKLIFNKLNIPITQYQNDHSKGVYFMPIHTNTREYLRNEISVKDLVADEKLSRDHILDWWREKSKRRFTDLFNKKKIKHETLWYKDLKLKDLIKQGLYQYPK